MIACCNALKATEQLDARTLTYQADINEQNSGENWSDGAEGGGWSTIASKSS